MRLETPFASLFLTALERGKDLADGKRALLTVVARQCNTGFSDFTPDNRVLKNGGPPVFLEPVTIAGRPLEAVKVLDHDGRRTGRTLAVTDGRFTLDRAKDKGACGD